MERVFAENAAEKLSNRTAFNSIQNRERFTFRMKSFTSPASIKFILTGLISAHPPRRLPTGSAPSSCSARTVNFHKGHPHAAAASR